VTSPWCSLPYTPRKWQCGAGKFIMATYQGTCLNLCSSLFANHHTPQVHQTPYSPTRPCVTFCLLLNDLKMWKRLNSQKLLAISKTEYKKCFQPWKNPWNNGCIQPEGVYFWRGLVRHQGTFSTVSFTASVWTLFGQALHLPQFCKVIHSFVICYLNTQETYTLM
jgi:hypothetical protein